MVILLGILWVLHYSPGTILHAIWVGSIGSRSGLAASIDDAVPDMLAATAVWLAFLGGLINIGVDGQLQIGGLAALVSVVFLPASTPAPVLIAVGILSGTIAGGFWAGIAAALKVVRGANEIIATIMLNFIAFLMITQLTNGPLRDRSATFTTATKQVPLGAQLQPIISGGNITWAILLATTVSVAVIFVFQRTNLGLRLRAIGLNREAAVHAGLRVPRYWFGSFCASGALSGLAGALVILGSRYYIAPGWANPWGLFGILIAFLSLSNPFLIPVWSMVFGMLNASGPSLKASAGVPDAITVMIQTFPVIVLYSLYAIFRISGNRRWQAALKREGQLAT